MSNTNGHSVTSRKVKSRSLALKRKIAAENGIMIHENVIVIEYPDGFVQVQAWDAEAEAWKVVLEKA